MLELQTAAARRSGAPALRRRAVLPSITRRDTPRWELRHQRSCGVLAGKNKSIQNQVITSAIIKPQIMRVLGGSTTHGSPTSAADLRGARCSNTFWGFSAHVLVSATRAACVQPLPKYSWHPYDQKITVERAIQRQLLLVAALCCGFHLHNSFLFSLEETPLPSPRKMKTLRRNKSPRISYGARPRGLRPR